MRRRFTAAVLLMLLMGAARAAEVDDRELLRPLYARPATTTTSFNMDAYVSYVDGLALQEAKDFKGWTAGVDLTAPLNRTMQLRFHLPVRTEGEAVLVSNGGKIDIDGWSGIYDYATLFFEHQLTGRDGGPNRFAWYLGAGWRTGVLETGTPDKYNHQGRSLHLGGRFERRLGGGGSLLLDAEYRSYEMSDDLNPASLSDDRFNFLRITGSWIGASRGVFTPALELTADAVLTGYFAAAVVPEVFLSAGNRLVLKLGVPVGVSSDAPDWGSQVRATFRF